MSNPKISVIIPMYNAEKYIGDCLNSVLSSDFTDYEVIVVNDGSSDQSPAIAADFSKKDSRVRVFNNDNHGPAFSRHFGVNKAVGEYILFVDSDDTAMPELLSTLYNDLTDNAADVVICQYKDLYENGKEVYTVSPDISARNIESVEECISLLHGSRQILGGPYCKLIKRECILDIDFHENVTIGEDYAMILQVLKKAKRVRIIPDILYIRNVHSGNISRSGYTDRHKKALDNYISIRNGLIEEFPGLEKEIKEYHLEYEMAVITAMCRNKNYDREVIKKLQSDLKANMDIIKQSSIPKANKISARIIVRSPLVFIVLFRTLHILTGR